MHANAATSLSGNALSKPYGLTGAATLTTGTLAMLIVDTAGTGFLGMNVSVTTSGSVLTSANDPQITLLNAGSIVGGTFGGNYIASVTTVGGTGVSGALSIPVSSTLYGKSWAMVFFDTTTITGTSHYGIVRGSDWTMPVSDIGGGITFSSTDASAAGSFFQVTSSAPTTAQLTTGFATEAAGHAATVFSIVPEPSAALLGALGALGLLRRRRI